eukprot:2506199-Amphidinium_carterae.1
MGASQDKRNLNVYNPWHPQSQLHPDNVQQPTSHSRHPTMRSCECHPLTSIHEQRNFKLALEAVKLLCCPLQTKH